jgi:GTPase SAR1 family protein
MENIKAKIMIWGDTGVGKTSFVKAIQREFTMDSRFSGFLMESLISDIEIIGDNFPLFANLEPSYQLTEYRYHMEISPIMFTLSTYDADGKSMMEAIQEQENNLINLAFKESIGVVALFNPRDSSEVLSAQLHKLLSYINNPSHNQKTYLALCFTKMDTVNLRWNDPKVVFEMLFGSQWITFINQLNSWNNNVETKIFLTSSVGYYKSEKDLNEKSNFFPPNKLHQPDAWMPWNVTQPLLWILSKHNQLQNHITDAHLISYF